MLEKNISLIYRLVGPKQQGKRAPEWVYYGRCIEGLSMPNFVTFDDGLNYVSISEIEGFGYEGEGPNKGGTWIKLRDGRTVQTSWEVSKVAELLGPTANLQY
jgi:hypothetical protein